jgi:hypothetical protein
MWLRLADRFTFDFLPGTVARYRIVATSMVRTLFVNPNPRHSFSIYLIHRKWLASGKLSSAQRAQWAAKIAAAAYALYRSGDPRAPRCLRFAARVAPTARLLLLAISASLGLSRSRAKRLAALTSFGKAANGVHE